MDSKSPEVLVLSTMSKSSEYWNIAYQNFSTRNAELEAALEKIFKLELSPLLAQRDPRQTRQVELSVLIKNQISRMEAREWKISIGSNTIRLRTQVDRILKMLSFVKGLGMQAASVEPLHAGPPVAALYLLLSFAMRDKTSRDALLNGLEEISDTVREYAIIEEVYLADAKRHTTAHLESALVRLYERVLLFQAQAACQFNHSVACQTFRNLLKGNSVWMESLDSIRQARSACVSLRNALDMEIHSNAADRLQKILKDQNQMLEESVRQSRKQNEEILAELQDLRSSQLRAREEDKKQDLLTALRTSEYEAALGELIPFRAPGTCTWFLDHHGYEEWLDQTSPALLWVTSDPGCGKSVLMKYLVTEFTEISEGVSHICYHFFKDGTETGTATAALCALLHQIFSQDDSLLRKHGMPYFMRNGTKIVDLFETLWEIFAKICRDPDKDDLWLFLDALDECNDSQRTTFVTRLAKLIADKAHVVRIKMLMTSRPNALLQNTMFKVATSDDFSWIQVAGENDVERKAMSEDVDIVIQHKIAEFKKERAKRKLTDDAHEYLSRKVLTVSYRPYLWVTMVFDNITELVGASRNELLAQVQDIPRSIEKFYETCLDWIPAAEREAAQKVLRIVLTARRELTLKELKIALSVASNGTYQQLDANEAIVNDFANSIRRLGGQFIRVEGSKVSMIHQTAREYLHALDSNGNSQETWPASFNPMACKHALAQSCIWYLCSPSFDTAWLKQNSKGQWKPPGNLSLDKFIQQHHFVEYAAKNWMLHLKESQHLADGALCSHAVKLCQIDGHCYRTWSKIYWHTFTRRPPPNTTDLSVAASFNLLPVIDTMVGMGYDLDLQDKDGDTALHAAAIHRRVEAARALVDHGASVSIVAEDGNVPLQTAAAHGSAPIVELLLKKDSEIEHRNNKGLTALHRAALFGHVEAAQALINAGANIHAVTEEGRTALHLASLMGTEDIKSRWGVDSNRYDRVIELLRQAGISEEAVDVNKQTARDLYRGPAKPDVISIR